MYSTFFARHDFKVEVGNCGDGGCVMGVDLTDTGKWVRIFFSDPRAMVEAFRKAINTYNRTNKQACEDFRGSSDLAIFSYPATVTTRAEVRALENSVVLRISNEDRQAQWHQDTVKVFVKDIDALKVLYSQIGDEIRKLEEGGTEQ